MIVLLLQSLRVFPGRRPSRLFPKVFQILLRDSRRCSAMCIGIIAIFVCWILVLPRPALNHSARMKPAEFRVYPVF